VGQGGEAELIVDDDVHRPTGSVGTKLGHLEGL